MKSVCVHVRLEWRSFSTWRRPKGAHLLWPWAAAKCKGVNPFSCDTLAGDPEDSSSLTQSDKERKMVMWTPSVVHCDNSLQWLPGSINKIQWWAVTLQNLQKHLRLQTRTQTHCTQQSSATSWSCCHGYCSWHGTVGKIFKNMLSETAFYESHSSSKTKIKRKEVLAFNYCTSKEI